MSYLSENTLTGHVVLDRDETQLQKNNLSHMVNGRIETNQSGMFKAIAMEGNTDLFNFPSQQKAMLITIVRRPAGGANPYNFNFWVEDSAGVGYSFGPFAVFENTPATVMVAIIEAAVLGSVPLGLDGVTTQYFAPDGTDYSLTNTADEASIVLYGNNIFGETDFLPPTLISPQHIVRTAVWYAPFSNVGLKIIGALSLGDSIFMITSADSTDPGGPGQIWEAVFTNGAFTTLRLLYSKYLNLSTRRMVTLRGRVGSQNRRILYWIEENSHRNPVRVAEVDMPNFHLAAENLLSLTLADQKAIISLVQVENTTGSLRSGSYQLTAWYEDEYGNHSFPFAHSNNVPVYEESFPGGLYGIDGCDPNTLTSKAIRWRLTGLNMQQKYVAVISIAHVNGSIRVTRLGRMAVSDTELEWLQTEINEEEELSSGDIANLFALRSARAITMAENRLILGNIQMENSVVDYQAYANAITSTPVRETISWEYYKDPQNCFRRRSFFNEDAVPLGIVWHLKDGGVSPVFHIPGTDTLDPARVHNTGIINPSGYGYPAGNATYHRIPAVDDLIGAPWAQFTITGPAHAHDLHIVRLDLNNIAVPAQIKETCNGFSIVRGRYESGRKVFGYGLIKHVWERSWNTSGEVVYTPAGVYGHDSGTYTLHKKMVCIYLPEGQFEYFNVETLIGMDLRFIQAMQGIVEGPAAPDHTNIWYDTVFAHASIPVNFTRRIVWAKIVQAGERISVNGFTNTFVNATDFGPLDPDKPQEPWPYAGKCIFAILDGDVDDPVYLYNTATGISPKPANFVPVPGDDPMKYMVCLYQPGAVFPTPDKLKYRSLGNYFPIDNNTSAFVSVSVYGDDAFISRHDQYDTCANLPAPPLAGLNEHSHAFTTIMQSRVNVALRHGENYHPRKALYGTAGLFESGTNQDMDWFYNPEYSSLNVLEMFLPMDPNMYQAVFPTMVQYSEKQVALQISDSYRVMKSNDNNVYPGEHGEITALESMNENVYMWQRTQFSRIVVDPRAYLLSEDSTNVQVSTGNDVLSKMQAFGKMNGTIHPRSITNNGRSVFWYDWISGAQYRFGPDGLNDISAQGGWRHFFRHLLRAPGRVMGQDPANGSGVIAFHDANHGEIITVFFDPDSGRPEYCVAYGDSSVTEKGYNGYRTMTPYLGLTHQGNVITFSNQDTTPGLKAWVQLVNPATPGSFYGISSQFVIEIIMNENPQNVKVMENFLVMLGNIVSKANFFEVATWSTENQVASQTINTWAYLTNKEERWALPVPFQTGTRRRMIGKWIKFRLSTKMGNTEIFEVVAIRGKYRISYI